MGWKNLGATPKPKKSKKYKEPSGKLKSLAEKAVKLHKQESEIKSEKFKILDEIAKLQEDENVSTIWCDSERSMGVRKGSSPVNYKVRSGSAQCVLDRILSGPGEPERREADAAKALKVGVTLVDKYELEEFVEKTEKKGKPRVYIKKPKDD